MKNLCANLLIIFFTINISLAQTNMTKIKYSDSWKKVEDAFNKGLNKTAQSEIEKILAQAKTEKNTQQIIKALCNLRVAMRDRDETSRKNDILSFEKELQTSSFPAKQLLHSMLAELYWSYYQENRYKILDRTTVNNEEKNNDFNKIELWSADDIYNKTYAHYMASLTEKEKAKNFPINNISDILEKGKNTENLRPTLYDFLIHRAIDYFKLDENELTKPAYTFEIDDEKAFANASTFCNAIFKTSDTFSQKYTALKLYQEIIKMHLNDADPSAWIDADIARIQYVYSKSISTNKSELYINALKYINTNYPNNKQAALAAVIMAELFATKNFDIERGEYDEYDDEEQGKMKTDFVTAKKICDAVVEKFPNCEASSRASSLLQIINEHKLAIETEKILLPNAAHLALINYKNIPNLFCKIIKINNDDVLSGLYNNYEESCKNIAKNKSLKEWNIALPQKNDYKEHSTEIKIDALPIGTYALVISESPLFEKNEITKFTFLRVSSLAHIIDNTRNGEYTNMYIVNRESGEPQKNVIVKLWQKVYDYKKNKYEKQLSNTYTSDQNGLVKLNKNGNNANYFVELIQENDDLFINDELYNYKYNEAEPKETIRTFLFTDRSIYRPNQTIYFKGIIIKTDAYDKNTHTVIKNKKVKVTLKDVNYQDVASLELTTNEFGSFTGEFKAPNGLLTGTFHIITQNISTPIQIEEYKRPKFEVVYDTMKDTYKLNETIHVKGIAKAYSGNNIDGAMVKYKVQRTAHFPYYWCYYRWGMPRSASMEIAHGITTTQADGSFNIDFIAKPDASIDVNTMPVFDYKIIADITDLNGETRTGETLISVSYQSLTIKIDATEKININDFNAVKILTTNLSGTHIASDVTLTLKKLKSPEHTYRSRLWGKPDILSIPENDFRKDFPLDEYNDENNYLHWEEEKTSWSKTITTTKEGLEYLQKTETGNGWYVLEAKTKDKDGNDVIDKKYIRLYDNESKALPSEYIFVTKTHKSAQPSDKVKITINTPYENVSFLYNSMLAKNASDFKWNIFTHHFSGIEENKVIMENDRGGIYTNGWYVKNNRFYSFSEFIEVPFTNKELYITTETFRDKILPGSAQEWKLKITGSKKEWVSAELLSTMYDASLDAFKPHQWRNLSIYQKNINYANWNTFHSFSTTNGFEIYSRPYTENSYFEKNYPSLNFFGLNEIGYYRRGVINMGGDRSSPAAYMMDGIAVTKTAAPDRIMSESSLENGAANQAPPFPNLKKEKNLNEEANSEVNSTEEKTTTVPQVELRSNFNETAFFFPQLHTDQDGNIILKFKAPDALTRWKMMAFAHTQNMAYNVFTKTSVTQKELMIVPNTPRFLREGDKIVYSAKVTNLSEQEIKGNATLQIIDANTENFQDSLFKNTNAAQPFALKKGESKSVTWYIEIPNGFTNPVIVKTTAWTKDLSDGEQNVVPVIPNSMLVTETLPLPVKPNTTKNFKFENLLNSKNSKTLSHYNLTLEYTSNPAWYAIQSLPYLTDYPYECAEQTFNRYYANAIATHIANSNPKIKEIFSIWKEKDTAALLSNLEKNQELKSALLQETPWVLEAKNETQQKKNIALLFDMNRMSKQLERSLRELELKQTPNGGFTWFKGMPEDRFMTQYILTGIGRLMHIQITEVGSERRIKAIIQKAIPYLDNKIKEDYEELKKYKADMTKQQIGAFQIQYLYMRSFFKEIPIQENNKTAFDFYLKQCGKYWLPNGKMMQAMSAIALHRWNDNTNAQAIIKSLRENAIHSEEMGMYYKDLVNSYWWHQAPIESQAMLIECFKEVALDENAVDELKIWLLKNKQTTNWKTTKATADACYALLLNGTYWLAAQPEVSINMGSKEISSTSQNKEAGTGYFKTSIAKEEIIADMGNITVKVKSDKSVGTTWGAVYWQYFENLDKIPSSETGLQLKKQLYKVTNTDKGEVLNSITENSPLQVGDKVKVRIELKVDRPLEYVHMKDMRSACFEPIHVISNYKYQGGLGYYEATKDLATNFFFHYLQKGTYVFEYPMFVTNKGDFSNGIATIQCMYAPEFSSHSEGIRVKVK